MENISKASDGAISITKEVVETIYRVDIERQLKEAEKRVDDLKAMLEEMDKLGIKSKVEENLP